MLLEFYYVVYCFELLVEKVIKQIVATAALQENFLLLFYICCIVLEKKKNIEGYNSQLNFKLF